MCLRIWEKFRHLLGEKKSVAQPNKQYSPLVYLKQTSTGESLFVDCSRVGNADD